MRSFCAGILLLYLLAGCNPRTSTTPSDVKPTEQSELDRLQGEWEIESLEVGGKVMAITEIKEKNYTLKGNELIPSKTATDPARLTLRSEESPAWIDLTDRGNVTMQGIYRIDGDRWTMCFGNTDRWRPSEFKTLAGERGNLMVLRRVKR
jgi:uncharacterized protein (TIGR03067 family)